MSFKLSPLDSHLLVQLIDQKDEKRKLLDHGAGGLASRPKLPHNAALGSAKIADMIPSPQRDLI
jgi:hypothetical protein